MFRFLFLLGLAEGVIVLGMRAHRGFHELVLVDLAPGASIVLHRAWAVLIELWPASGILAAALLLLALAAALGLSHLHADVVLERQRERVDRTYCDDEFDAARWGRARAGGELAATKTRLKAALRDLAESERARRTDESRARHAQDAAPRSGALPRRWRRHTAAALRPQNAAILPETAPGCRRNRVSPERWETVLEDASPSVRAGFSR